MNTILEDMLRLRNIINNNAYDNRGYNTYPLINVYDKEEFVEIEAKLPGVEKDKLNINFENSVLTISGEVAKSRNNDDKCIRNEREYGKFDKSLKIGFPIDPNKIEANYENGILKIKMTKAEEAKPKKITIK